VPPNYPGSLCPDAHGQTKQPGKIKKADTQAPFLELIQGGDCTEKLETTRIIELQWGCGGLRVSTAQPVSDSIERRLQ
jgi:hypothetical protein